MDMVIDLKPETEELLKRELSNGTSGSVDEIIVRGIQSRRAMGKPPLKTVAEAVAHLRASRVGNVLPPGVTIEDLINEGRD